jgi:hypothetical protein
MKRIAAIAITLLLCLSAYAMFVSFSVRKQAQEIAGEKPFCLQVRKSAGYMAVTGVKDTLGLLMKGRGGYHHAALVVGDLKAPDTYHWSYFRNEFVQGTYGPLPIVCVPGRNYFSQSIERHHEENLTFALQGKILSIPKVFHPAPLWPGSTVGYYFQATAPLFVPADEICSKRLCNMVHVAFHGGATPQGWANGSKADYRIEELGNVHGLKARRFTALRGKPHVTYDYVQRADDGKAVTYVTCFDDPTVQCTHLFSERGLTYSFHHMPEDLLQWNIMQERLIDLNKTFEQHGEAALGDRSGTSSQ